MMRFVILLALILAGCCAPPAPPVVDVDALNAADQARLQAQADKEARKP